LVPIQHACHDPPTSPTTSISDLTPWPRRPVAAKDSYVQEAVVEYLDDLENLYLAKRRLDDIRAGRARTPTLAEVGSDLGLQD
jgi:predicted DNA-binding protein